MVRLTWEVNELETKEMKKYLVPGLVIALGVLCIVPHLTAANCGEPVYSAPAKCKFAEAESPGQDSGDCSRDAQGVCGGSVCEQSVWGTAVPGRCEPQTLIETVIPQCESGSTTTVEIKKWQAVCYSQEICWCLWDETEEMYQVEVCTCTKLN